MSKQARVRTQEMRKAQQEAAARGEKRRRLLTVIGGVVIVALVIAIVFAVTRAASSGDDGPSTDDVVTPANTTDGSIPVGDDSAPVTVTLYYDYMCPACGAFEKANGDELDRLLADGDMKLELRP